MDDLEQIQHSIDVLESQRETLGDDVVEAALAPMREKLAALQKPQKKSIKQRKQVTVLFSDVSGFTALSESLDPEAVSDLMDGLWQRVDAEILKNGGMIDKHIGDAVMALFGAPIAREDAPESAIRAGLEMQRVLREYVEDVKLISPEGEHLLKIRIGINTGLALLGEVGANDEYTAMGDAVNVASRLEHAAPLKGVLISHDTYQHVRGLFEAQLQEPLKVKGKVEPIRTYLIEKALPKAFRAPTRGVIGVETEMVGREEEFQKLKNALKVVTGDEKSKARVVTVLGEAGIGKSRLLHEFTKWLEIQPERIHLLKGRSTEDMGNLSFSLIRNLLSRQFEIKDSDPTEAAKSKLREGVLSLAGEAVEETIPFLGHLIGFDFSSDPLLKGILDDTRQVHNRAFHGFAQIISEMINEAPVVILLEDIHWADEGSLELIEYLAEKSTDLSLLVVCLSRRILYESHPTWGELEPIFEKVELEPLSDELDIQLVNEILKKVPNIPDELREAIILRAEGNPFYIEEFIKILIEDGVIQDSSEEWQVNLDLLKKVEVPATLTSLIQTRLDNLEATEKDVMQRASVVGIPFWDQAVGKLLQDEGDLKIEDDLHLTSLANLQKKELVFKQPSSGFADTNEYLFKNNILAEVTYESVLINHRTKFHKQVADWLIEKAGERVTEYAGRIGEHFELSNEYESAAVWYEKEGDQAKSTYLPQAAAEFYQKSLSLLEKRDDEGLDINETKAHYLELYNKLGEVFRWQGLYAESLDAFKKMQQLAEELGNIVRQIQSTNHIAMIQMYSGELKSAIESAGEAELLARKENLHEELCRSLFLKGWGHFRTGDIESALVLAQESLTLSKELTHPVSKAENLNLLGVVLSTMGNFDEGSDYFEQALEIRQDMDDLEGVMYLLNNLGVNAEAHSDYPAAYERYQEAIDVAHRLGKKGQALLILSNLGGAQVGLGNYQEAENTILEVINHAEELGSMGELSATYAYLAQAYLGQTKTPEALEAALKSLEFAQDIESPEEIGKAWRVLALVAAALEKPISIPDSQTKEVQEFSSAACFAKSEAVFSELGNATKRARTLKAWAIYEIENGDQEKGQAMWIEAKNIFEELGIVLEVEKMSEIPK